MGAMSRSGRARQRDCLIEPAQRLKSRKRVAGGDQRHDHDDDQMHEGGEDRCRREIMRPLTREGTQPHPQRTLATPGAVAVSMPPAVAPSGEL